MCVTCLFDDHDLSLLSTKHVDLHTKYNTAIIQHKNIIQHNQTRQAIEKCLFNILHLLRCCDEKDMA
jgi:hypothetical protein